MKVQILIESFFFRVALGLAALFGAGLWFVATKWMPETADVTANGTTHHLFLQPVFLFQVFLAYLMILPVVYGLARAVRWLTCPPTSPSQRGSE